MLYDLTLLKELSNNDPAVFNNFIEMFVTDINTAAIEVSNAYNERDFNTISMYFHKIKSPLTSISAFDIKSVVLELEQKAKDKIVSNEHKEMLMQFQSSISQLVELLDKEKMKID